MSIVNRNFRIIILLSDLIVVRNITKEQKYRWRKEKIKKSKKILLYLLTNRKSWSIITRKVECTTFISLKCGFAKLVGLTGPRGCEITIERYQ